MKRVNTNREEIACYGVRIARDNGSFFLAGDEHGFSKMYFFRREALRRAKDLTEAGLKAQVCGVVAGFSFPAPRLPAVKKG